MLTQNRQFQWFHEPSYLFPCVPAYAASLLKSEGHEVAWCDAIAEHKDWAAFSSLLRDFKPELVLMETKSPVVRQHWSMVDRIRAGVFLGGYYYSLLAMLFSLVLVCDHFTFMLSFFVNGNFITWGKLPWFNFVVNAIVVGQPLVQFFISKQTEYDVNAENPPSETLEYWDVHAWYYFGFLHLYRVLQVYKVSVFPATATESV